MATAGQIDSQSVHVVTARAKTLINAQLKAILRQVGMPVSGPKAVMQDRIISLINSHVQKGDVAAFNRIRSLITNTNHDPSSPSSTSGTASFHNRPVHPIRAPSSYTSGTQSMAYAQGIHTGGQRYSVRDVANALEANPRFKESPFYSIIEPLTPVLECKVREATRDQVDCKINFRADTIEKLSNDSQLKIMVYSASEPLSSHDAVDIAFPHQVEIKVNQDEVKANLRGLKNKPGSTRPADITPFLRKRAGYENSMTVIYALTSKRFYIVVNLVKQYPAEELVSKLETGKIISKHQVIREMVLKNQDPDIVATSSILSLKCPLSTLRMAVPCRSTICTHNQCFDALSFLQLQEQAPTWTCPVCNKVISFSALQVDQYMNDILSSTPPSVDQVTVEPDGTWSQITQKEVPGRTNGAQSSDDDDDLVEIQNIPRLAAIKDETFPTPTSMARTPPYSSREPSSSSAAPRSNNSKRQVIDLTFSSDEEDQPPHDPKRQMTQSSSTTLFNSYSSSGMSMRRPSDHSTSLTRLPSARPIDVLGYGRLQS